MQNVISPTTEIIERLKHAQNLALDADLARVLGVPPKKLAVWKLRNTVPIEELISFCRQYGYNLEWVLTGNGAVKGHIRDPRVTEAIEVYRTGAAVMDKRHRKLTEKLSRILIEDDPKKVKALEALLEILDPGDRGE